jgi:rhodanese-related sulfurtransferase
LAKGGLVLSEAVSLEPALWVDARPEDAFMDGHYPGALNINEDNWGEGISSLLEAWDPGESVIVYCDGQSCSASREMAERIRSELGLEPVFWLKGGYEEIAQSEGFLE